MKYFFVLGINPALSAAEIGSVLDFSRATLLAQDFLVVDSQTELNASSLMKRLGGTIKIGREFQSVPKNDRQAIESAVRSLADVRKYQSQEGKFNFGFSDYGPRVFDKKSLGLGLKKYFSEQGVSSRFVVSREKTLSSVVVTQNKLLSRGVEVVLAEHGDEVIIAETLAVQDFKDLSRRDYGRPARDDHSGMLPPKLAQIMINLAQVEDEGSLIADPFCGSGTILCEAMLLGYKNLLGTDISKKATDDTYKNTSWIKELYKIEGQKLKIMTKSATEMSKFVPAGSISAIITEPYLGPQRGNIDFKKVVAELELLYSNAIGEFLKVLRPKSRVVMIWPLFYGHRPIRPKIKGFRLCDVLPASISQSPFIKKNRERTTLIYSRPGQRVYREIAVLEKE